MSHCCKISRSQLQSIFQHKAPYYLCWPQIFKLKPRPPSKKSVFLVKYKIEVKMTSFIDMLELPNFGHRTTSTVSFEWSDEVHVYNNFQSWTEIMWKCNFYLYFQQYSKKRMISDEQILTSAEFEEFAKWFTYFFGSSLGQVKLCQVLLSLDMW